MEITDIIDWILRCIQIITFLGVILKISFQNDAYIDNVEISSIVPMEFDSLHSRFHHIREYNHVDNQQSTNHFLFYPKGTDIKKVEFYSLEFDTKLKEKKIQTITNLENHDCLLIHTSLIGTIPHLRMRWETSFGELGEFTFYLNGYNGNINISSYKYKLSWKNKLQKVFGL